MSNFKMWALTFSTAIIGISNPANADWWSRNVAPIGHAIEKGTHDAGNAIEKGAHDIGNTLEKGAHDTGDTLEKGAHDVGHSIEKGAQDTGKAAEKALHDTGYALEDAGQFVEEHPWETVMVVAFVAGGAYLIVYQGFALELTVGEHVVATFTAAEMGTASVAAGAGTALVAANRPASASDLYDATDGKETDASKATPKPETPEGKSVLELPRLNSPAPVLANNATNTQKLGFAYQVLEWTEVSQPFSTFNVDDYPSSLSPMEQKLIEARLVIETVPDSPADIAAKQQAQERRDFVKDQLADKAKDLLTGKLPDPTDVAKDALLEALKPTIVGDGWSASRETMKNLIDHELNKYAVKRVPCLRTPTKPECLKAPVEGPVIQAVP
ncbi:hypothetical protein HFO91_30340 [Rhizobium leguminosarum]|uniref:hypothetical protein n=1 Tax=Rhizobium leguminosarum TaxID=384 RepID=UPI001C978D0B|nr:hypothetical protein [Rhizobium leguminosarum]MBY5453879.1 hypothetical protein [Rhizobium leguminosarum]